MATQILGIIGEVLASGTDNNTFSYNLITPDFSQQPTFIFEYTFTGVDDYPTSSGVFDQRRLFVSTNNEPNGLFFSAINRFNNFLISSKISEAFNLVLDTNYFDPIVHIIPSQFGILLFSERSVHLVLSGTGTGINALNAVAKQELTSGAKIDITPISVLKDVVYLSNLDNTPRILSPVNTTPNQFNTKDIAIFSQHLFKSSYGYIDQEIASQLTVNGREGMEIRSWAYAGRTDRIIWVVRADGVLLSCTFVPEHGVSAWCKHTTKGKFLDVATVYEKEQDAVYMVVERGGHKFIEKFALEENSILANTVPVDCAVKSENFNTLGRVETTLQIKRYKNGLWVDKENTIDTVDDNPIIKSFNYSGLVIQIEPNGAFTFADPDVNDWIKTPGGIYKITQIINRFTVLIEPLLSENVDLKGTEYFITTGDNELIDAGSYYNNASHLVGIMIGTATRHLVYHWELINAVQVFNVFHFRNQEVKAISGFNFLTSQIGENVSAYQVDDLQNQRGITIGFSFNSVIETLPFLSQELPTDNKPIRINNISLRCFQSSSMQVSNDNANSYPLIYDRDGEQMQELSTGVFKIPIGSDWKIESTLKINSELPFNILGVIVSYDVGQLENQRARVR